MQNIPKCPHCNRTYCTRDANRRGVQPVQTSPLLLLCGHTFCVDCLSRIARVQKTGITCPLASCQQVTHLNQEGSLKSLSPDIYVTGLLAAFNSTPPPLHTQMMEFFKPGGSLTRKPKVKEELCEECKKPATCYCPRCQGNLCGACFSRIHSASNMLRQHQAVPLIQTEATSPEGSSKLNWPEFCQVHLNRPVEYYCDTDNVAICSYCAVMGDHQGHQISSSEDKNKSVLIDLDRLIASATSALNYSKKSYQMLHAIVTSSRSASRNLIEDIQLRFQQLHSVLQARELVICQEVLKLTHDQLNPLEDMQADLSDHMKNLELALSEGRSVIVNSKMTSVPRSLNRLRQLVAVPCHAIQTTQPESLRCEPDIDRLLSGLQLYGTIQGSVVGNVELKKLEDVVVNEPLVEPGSVGNIAPAMTLDTLMTLLPTRSQSASSSTTPSSFAGKCNRANTSDVETISVSSDNSGSSSRVQLPFDSCSSMSSAHKRKQPFKLPPRNPPSLLAANQAKVKQYRTEPVFVAHIRNPCHFVVQLNRDIDRLNSLSRDINNYCNMVSANEIPTCVEPDDLVLARFHQDKRWYRARVLKVIEADRPSKLAVEVLFIDYGNSETVPIDSVRNIQPKFLKDPEMSMLCSLVDIVPARSKPNRTPSWSKEAIASFASMICNKIMLLTVIQETNLLRYVDLSRPASVNIEDDGPVSVRDALVFLGFAHFVSPHTLPSSATRAHRRRYLTPESPSPGQLFHVKICHFNTPDDFFVQLLGNDMHYIIELMANLQATYNDDPCDNYTVYCPSKGMMCVSRYTVDQMWYRAEVIDVVDSNNILVKYVDFGNTETVSVWQLRKLLDSYTILPKQAFHCALADVACKDGAWPDEVSQFILALLSNETELIMNVKDNTDNQSLKVFLQAPNEKHSINSTFVSSGWATATGIGWELAGRKEKKASAPSTSGHNISTLQTNSNSSTNVGSTSNTAATNSSSGQVSTASGKPFYPEISVSHFITPTEIYVLELSREDALIRMMTDLQEAMKDTKSDPDTLWTSNMECAARVSTDNRWYRSLIIEPVGLKYKVVLLDYGTETLVDKVDLRPLPDVLAVEPGFALSCHLAEIVPAGDIRKWSHTACEALSTLLTNHKTCYLVPKGPAVNGSLPVDLLLEETIIGGALSPDTVKYNSVTQQLKEKGLALSKRPTGKFEIELRHLNRTDTDRQVPLCTLVFGSSTSQPSKPSTATMVPAAVKASSSQGLTKTDSALQPTTSCSSQLSSIDPPTNATAVVSPVNSGYISPPSVHCDDVDFPPAIVPNIDDELTLIVTHVDNSCNIFGHLLTDDITPLRNLMEDYQKHYENSVADVDRHWVKGHIAVAQFTDNLFYRVRVVDVRDDDMVEVLYVDFGNTEVLNKSRLRADPIHTNVPIQVFCCQLHGIRWMSDDGQCPPLMVEIVRSIVVNQTCSVNIKGRAVADDGSDIYQVQMVLANGQDFGQLLVDARHAQFELVPHVITPRPDLAGISNIQNNSSNFVVTNFQQVSMPSAEDNAADIASDLCITSTLSVKRVVKSPYRQLSLPELGDSMIVSVTDIERPDVIHLQYVKVDGHDDLKEINQQLDQLMLLSEFYSTSWQDFPFVPLDEIKPGLACLAQCTVDEFWYRAEVLDVRHYDGEAFEASISFVDYGSSDYIFTPNKLRILPTDHLDLPAQAMVASIANLQPANDQLGWNPNDVTLIAELLTNKVLRAIVKGVDNDVVHVELYEEELFEKLGDSTPLIYQTLVDAGYMKTEKQFVSDQSVEVQKATGDQEDIIELREDVSTALDTDVICDEHEQ